MNSKSIIITVVVAVVVGALAFFGGMQYAKSSRIGQFQTFTRAGAGGQAGANGTFRARFGQNGETPVRGQITSSDNGSVTIKMQDGSSKIVLVSGSTQITKATAGSMSDLKNGDEVLVLGTNNSDGSVTAQTVQLNPGFGRPGLTPIPTQ